MFGSHVHGHWQTTVLGNLLKETVADMILHMFLSEGVVFVAMNSWNIFVKQFLELNKLLTETVWF